MEAMTGPYTKTRYDLLPEGFPAQLVEGCLVDATSIERAMPPPSEWERVFDGGKADDWFRQMDAKANIRPGLALIELPRATKGENLFLFHTGWGDGVYAIVGGFNEAGDLVAVHVDLLVL